MDIAARKALLINWIENLENETIISRLETFRSFGDDWDEQVTPAEQNLVYKGWEDMEAGRVFSHEEIRAEIQAFIERSGQSQL